MLLRARTKLGSSLAELAFLQCHGLFYVKNLAFQPCVLTSPFFGLFSLLSIHRWQQSLKSLTLQRLCFFFFLDLAERVVQRFPELWCVKLVQEEPFSRNKTSFAARHLTAPWRQTAESQTSASGLNSPPNYPTSAAGRCFNCALTAPDIVLCLPVS